MIRGGPVRASFSAERLTMADGSTPSRLPATSTARAPTEAPTRPTEVAPP